MPASKPVDQTVNTGRPTVENMGVNHRRLHVLMTEQFLKRADIVAILKQMSSKGMPECMTGGPFGDACLAKGFFQRFL